MAIEQQCYLNATYILDDITHKTAVINPLTSATAVLRVWYLI